MGCILMDDQLYQRAKEIGLFGPRIPETTLDPKIQLEIEKIRDERERWLEQQRDERERWYAEFKAKQQMEERRWQVVENLMKGPLGNVVQTLGGAAASKISGTRVHSVEEHSMRAAMQK